MSLFRPPLLLCRTAKKALQPKGARGIHPVHQRHKDEKLMFGGVLEKKKEKKKRQKKEAKESISPGSAAPGSEEHWFANLSSKDVKLYRKTPSGRYREVDKTRLYETLKSIEADKSKNVSTSIEKKLIMPRNVLRHLSSVPMINIEPLESTEPSEDVRSGMPLPSVTRILSETMSEQAKAALERWKMNMIAEMGEEGFYIYNKEQLSFGSRFHSCIHRFLKSGDAQLDSDLEKVWSSVSRVLPKISDVQLLETGVHHSKLMYKGIVDCVASYMDTPSVIEWKVSQKSKPYLSATYDAPIQLSAYLGALSYDLTHKTNLMNGLVVVAYKDGAPADVFPMNEEACLKHWALWLGRLERFWERIPYTEHGKMYQVGKLV